MSYYIKNNRGFILYYRKYGYKEIKMHHFIDVDRIEDEFSFFIRGKKGSTITIFNKIFINTFKQYISCKRLSKLNYILSRYYYDPKAIGGYTYINYLENLCIC